MKSKYKNINPFAVLLVVLLAIFYGCNEYSSIGIEILPGGDLLYVKNKLIKDDISAFTFSEDSVPTDEPSQNLIGSFNDSLFGVTTVHYATQYRLDGFPNYGKDNPHPDSLILYIYYKTIYGDTLTPQRLRVYELESGIDRDKSYTQEIDLKSMASSELLGELEFTPRVKIDTTKTTKDSLTQVVAIRLKQSLAEKIFSADSLTVASNDRFLNYFKGLYIESEKRTSQGGSLLSLESVTLTNLKKDQTSVRAIGSALVLYYHTDTLKSKVDNTKDSVLMMPYASTGFSARVNQIVHDYSKAPFYQNLNTETNEDSLIYVQSTGGLKSRILIDNLETWKDSMKISGQDTFRYGINKAELIFQIDTIASQVHRFPPPGQLLFTAVDEDGKEVLPVDFEFSPSFYGGNLRSDYTYHFNITQHLQLIIANKAENRGFYLTPAYKNNQGNRVVLKGSGSKTGIKLSITYSKYNE